MINFNQSAARQDGNNFDFLRFLLAALVVFSHSFVIAGQGASEPLSWLSGSQTYLGEVAVNGFFVISGFLITASWTRSRNARDYFQKRVLRIYPGFVVICLLCALIVGPLGAASPATFFHQFSPVSFLSHMLLLGKLDLPTTFHTNPVPDQVNGSLWTIKIEFECYLLIAALGLLGGFKRRLVPLALLLASCAVSGAASLHLRGLPALPEFAAEHLRFFVYFFAGMVFYLYRDKILYRLPLLIGAVAVIAVGTWGRYLQAVMALPLTYLLMYAAFRPSAALASFGQKRDLSYGLYLYAWPIQQILAALLVTRLHGAATAYLLFAAALLPALLCAWASWQLVEKPCLNLVRKPSHAQEAGEIAVVMAAEVPMPAPGTR